MAPTVISYADAKAKGLKRYFTGKPCKRGHVAERFVINCACTACTLARTDEWLKDESNLVLKRRQAREWHERNPEYANQWVKENPDARRKIARKWYVSNTERAIQVALDWARKNPEKRRTNFRNRKSRIKGAAGSHTAQQILDLLESQNWQCVGHNCSKSLRDDRHIDHIMPLLLGGSNYIWNLQGLCPTCNCKKNGKHPIIWAEENGIVY